MNLNSKQKGVVGGALPAVLITLVGLCGVSLVIPISALPLDDPGARLAWALQWSLLPILALLIAVMRVANYRFYSPEDIDGSGLTNPTPQIQVLRALLQNTLEQAVMAVAVYSAWAAAMPFVWLRAIPVAAVLFIAGRVLFARGYRKGAAARAMGFGLSMYPTVTLLATLVAVLCYRILA